MRDVTIEQHLLEATLALERVKEGRAGQDTVVFYLNQAEVGAAEPGKDYFLPAIRRLREALPVRLEDCEKRSRANDFREQRFLNDRFALDTKYGCAPKPVEVRSIPAVRIPAGREEIRDAYSLLEEDDCGEAARL